MKIVGIIMGVLIALCGLFCFSHPVLTFTSLGWLIGLAALANGIGNNVAWWKGRKDKTSSTWDLVAGILALIVGILILANFGLRALTDAACLIVFGVWMVVAGILRVVGAIKLKMPLWGFGVFWGILLVILGVYALFHPMVSLLSLGMCIAFSLISQGINLIIGVCMSDGNKTAAG